VSASITNSRLSERENVPTVYESDIVYTKKFSSNNPTIKPPI